MAYAVPPLPYDYDALEPHIDEQTMRIHHDKHHQAYVDKVNAALEGTDWADRPIEEVLTSLDRIPDDKRTAVRNNGGGHFNHTLFWESMSPDGGGAPSGDLGRGDRRGVRLLRRLPGQAQGRRRQPVRLRLGLARPRRRRARGRLDRQPGQPHLGRQDAAPRRRRLGARLLPALPEQAPGLPRRLVEHRRLGPRRRSLLFGVDARAQDPLRRHEGPAGLEADPAGEAPRHPHGRAEPRRRSTARRSPGRSRTNGPTVARAVKDQGPTVAKQLGRALREAAKKRP